MFCQEGLGAEREKGEESSKAQAMKVKAMG
jgi:hypothetical protein